MKSRLAADVGEEFAMLLYQAFVLDLFQTLKEGGDTYLVCYSPEGMGEKMEEWLGSAYRYVSQRGSDLGERMKNAFLDAFGLGFARACIVGSDIPDIAAGLLHDGLDLQGYDAAIGPSLDGGYYLIAFRKETFLPEIFSGIEWGTEHVFRDTMEIFAGRNMRVKVLPIKRDIDRIGDLKLLYEANLNTPFSLSETMKCIRSLFKSNADIDL